MHTHAADPQLSRDGARPNTVLVHRSNLLDRHCRLAVLVDAVRLGSLDTSLLALSYEASLKFGHHAQHCVADGQNGSALKGTTSSLLREGGHGSRGVTFRP
jgi:hypothetical protein